MRRLGKRSGWVVLIVAALVLITGGCGGGGGGGDDKECTSNEQCGAGTCNLTTNTCDCPADATFKCSADAMCVACCQASDCDDSACPGAVECSTSNKCKILGLIANADCSKDPTACCGGLGCDPFTNTCMTECSGDSCKSRDLPFADDLACENGVCDFDHCTDDGGCLAPKVCYDGACVSVPDCADVVACKVLPGSAITKDGTTVQLSATAYLQSGAIAPGVAFTWTSSATAIAAVSATGLVTGGATTGSAGIDAAVEGCPAVDCNEVAVTNYGLPGAGTQVVVIDEFTKAPIQGATVEVEGEISAALTDAAGVFTSAADLSAAAKDVTVSKADYGYLTLRKANSNNVLVSLVKLYGIDTTKEAPANELAGGLKGKFDFGMITCEAPMTTCEVTFGLGGISIPGNLINLNFNLLIGEMLKTSINLGGSPQVVPLPAGLTLNMGTTPIKPEFWPTGIPGARLGWGLGGKLDLQVLLQILAPVITGGGDVDFGGILVQLLPLFANFYTAILPNLDIVASPKVVDVGGINDNDSTTDYVPDFANATTFPKKDMALKVKMSETMNFTVGALAQKPGGGWYFDMVIVLGGLLVKDQGFVPLGISAGLDSPNKETPANGTIEAIELKVADVAGRIPEGQYQRVVIAMALKSSGLFGGNDKLLVGGKVLFVDEFNSPGGNPIPLNNFYLPPTKAVYQAATRTLSLTGLDLSNTGVSYNQVTLEGDQAINWQVMGVFADGDYVVPAAPATGDRAKTAAIISAKLRNGLTLADIVAFNDTNMDNLVQYVEEFSFAEVPECVENADCAVGTCDLEDWVCK